MLEHTTRPNPRNPHYIDEVIQLFSKMPAVISAGDYMSHTAFQRSLRAELV